MAKTTSRNVNHFKMELTKLMGKEYSIFDLFKRLKENSENDIFQFRIHSEYPEAFQIDEVGDKLVKARLLRVREDLWPPRVVIWKELINHYDKNNLLGTRSSEDLEILEEIELTINSLKNEIHSCTDFQFCQKFFDKLEHIQFILSILLFKHDIKLSTVLNRFVHEYDRLDDIETRIHLYNAIRSHKH